MTLIALVDKKWGIAKDGKQICYIPDDLRRFKKLTMGGSIVLGRKTLLNFPDGKPLPGRKNYILSKKIGIMDDAIICRSISDIPADVLRDGWCVGGESVYRQLLPYCDRAFITLVDEYMDADQFCPNLEINTEWELDRLGKVGVSSGMRYQFLEYRRKSDDWNNRESNPRDGEWSS